jgi:ribose 5-phosphate isomerase B
MRIAIGSDHRGLETKTAIVAQVKARGEMLQDFGTFSAESVDYPDIALKVAAAVAGGKFDLGILVCGTGIGMSIAANKIRGIRAALCHDVFTAGRARQHTDANILCLGAETATEIPQMVETFLTAKFEGGRHQRRLDKLNELGTRI